MSALLEVAVYGGRVLEPDEPRLARLAATLDAEERARAARFVFARDARRFVAAHGFLRETLAGELRCAPAALRFVLGPFGKPRLAQGGLEFSLTHSGDHAWLALAQAEIGLDAEEVTPARVDPDLARRVMTTEELEAWWREPPEGRVRSFFQLWSAKESVMKATGRGMGLGPRSFAVLEPGSTRTRAAVAIDGRSWHLVPVGGAPDHALCLAAPGEARVARHDLA